ncbi:HesA/MoeB/ThiF family protein [Geomonas propionica]|uniref:ThiF family adenylyltransferase n=1 Tax=Geomonas propionica TaxID=2798582 RepID=A0ABS0YLL2_9BACT|nr:ThiF family adenylyltransferase [Geomonas propionica]MBJ6798823.1 ThiF family adenylyltransferase [Geomonas propionica]
MNKPRITLLGSQDRKLRQWLSSHPYGHERGAIVLFRKLGRAVADLPGSDRFLAVDIIPLTEEWVLESSPTQLRINMRLLPEVFFRCEKENLELGFVHGHPPAALGFSPKDDINELNILQGLSGCNGPCSFLVAMVLSDGHWLARVRQGLPPRDVISARHICVLSDKIELHGIVMPDEPDEILKRQEAAFGKPFNSKLQSLRVAVVGAGGTGSPVATLLARAGVGELIIIDGDDLDKTNLNRVRGYRAADEGKKKALLLKTFIDSLELNVSVSAIDQFLDAAKALDALSTADVIFGCTDDVAGRNLMNQALYYHAQLLIDCGLTGRVDTSVDGTPFLRDHRGRVSCILPEAGACLRCQRVVTDEKLAYEDAVKKRPELAKLDPITLKRDYYLIGGGEQAPGVGPFTSATADNAVATFMDLIKPYRQLSPDLRQDNIWIDFVHMTIHSNQPVDNSDCVYCRTHDLLLRPEGKYRLEIPRLGEIYAPK